jgi:hypothetical protein
MNLRHTIAVIAVAGTIAAIPATAPAQRVAGPTAVAAKTCISNFVSARINGRHKCLHAGEFCTHRYDRHAPHRYAYIHYGFRCTKYYSNVDRYRLTYAR